MPADKISIQKAKKNKLFYFVANVAVYRRRDKQVLILKRSRREKVHPGVYAFPGGKLEWEDLDLNSPTRRDGEVLDFEDAIDKLARREAKEEAGVELGKEMRYLDSYAFVRPDGIPVVFIKYAAAYKSGKVQLEKDSFTDYAWVNAQEVKKYQGLMGLNNDVKKTIRLFNHGKTTKRKSK